MRDSTIVFWATILGAICWPVCFVWMHRISRRQEDLLRELQEQTKRIEELSREEHELIREVHPNVDKIKNDVEAMADEARTSSKTRGR